MDIFGISDLHLPGGEDKPMDVFGTEWSGHAERVATAWKDLVAPDDLVLLPGALSRAMTLPVVVKGINDLRWKSIRQLRPLVPAYVVARLNDFYQLPGQLAVCGTRGWKSPGAADFTPDDEKIYRRELERLRLSLQTAQDRGCRPYIVMLHYPPTAEGQTESELTELMEAAGVQYCIYGHLHGPAQRQALTGTHRGIAYHLVACDAIGFKPLYVTSLPG